MELYIENNASKRSAPRESVGKVVEYKRKHKLVRDITTHLEKIMLENAVAIRIVKTQELIELINNNISYILASGEFSPGTIKIVKISLKEHIIPETEEYAKRFNAEFAKGALEIFNQVYNKLK